MSTMNPKLRDFLRDVFSWDILLHTLLLFALYFLLRRSSSWGLPIALCLFIFIREMTQVQCKYFSNHFLEGWVLWAEPWNRHKHFEWLIPTILFLVAVYFLTS